MIKMTVAQNYRSFWEIGHFFAPKTVILDNGHIGLGQR